MRAYPRRIRRSAILLPAILSLPPAALAVDATWIGPSGGTWSVGANWSGGVVPTGLARIDGTAEQKTVLITSGVNIIDLHLDPGDTLQLEDESITVGGASMSNGGTIDMVGSARLHVVPNFALGGGGVINLTSSGIEPEVYGPDSRLVNLDNTIQGWGMIRLPLTNHGTVIASTGPIVLGNPFSFDPVPHVNRGMLKADGGLLLLSRPSLDNVSGVVEAVDGSEVRLDSPGSITGGTLRTSGTGVITQRSSPFTLTDLTLDGHYVSTTSGQELNIQGTIHNLGSITFGATGNSAPLRVADGATATLTGGGLIEMVNNAFLHSFGPATLVSNNTIRGRGSIFGLALQNSGTVAASGTLTWMSGGSATNTGTVMVESGATLRLRSFGTPVNSTDGRIRILGGGTLELFSNNWNLQAGSIEVDGTLRQTGGSFSAATVAGAGTYLQTAGTAALKRLDLSAVSISGGTTTINPGGGATGTSRLKSLTITAAGKLNLTNHDLILDFEAAAPIDPQSIRAMLASAYAGGAWTGPGLTSSSAAASTDPKTALGYLDNTDGAFTEFGGLPVDDSSILVKYTLAGDANFDERIDVHDLLALAMNWRSAGVWETGDFNYDGFVDKADLGVLAINWHGELEDALLSVGLEGVTVPEPGAGLAMLGVVGWLRRRRRN